MIIEDRGGKKTGSCINEKDIYRERAISYVVETTLYTRITKMPKGLVTRNRHFIITISDTDSCSLTLRTLQGLQRVEISLTLGQEIQAKGRVE